MRENRVYLGNTSVQSYRNNSESDIQFGNKPLYFIKNEGQVNDRVLFYTKTSGYTLWITKTGLVFDSVRSNQKSVKKDKLKKYISKTSHFSNSETIEPKTMIRDVSRLVFQNSNPDPEIIPIEMTDYKVNYFIGNDRSKGKTNIPTMKAVLYRNLYSNIDLKVYGSENQIEYDLTIRPGGNPNNLRFEYNYIEKLIIDENGNLVITTNFGDITHKKPKCYQIIHNKIVYVDGYFKIIGNNSYSFKVMEYNKNFNLIIDPVILVFSTYLGGDNYEMFQDLAVDKLGHTYVTGTTTSYDFPTKNAYMGISAFFSAFVTKFTPAGNELIYSTYISGGGMDQAMGIALDSDNNVYIVGGTYSPDFPTINAYQPTIAGDGDSFIAKLNISGSELLYSTFLGGTNFDIGTAMEIDSYGNIYILGDTESVNFPTKQAYQKLFAGNSDVFIAQLNASISELLYSTYLGGTGAEYGFDLTIKDQLPYVAGATRSNNFPTINAFQVTHGGEYDGFLAKLNTDGTKPLFSTYLGKSKNDSVHSITLDSLGNIYIAGYTENADFPTLNAYQGTFGGVNDGFITKFNPSCSALIFSTFLGGSDIDYIDDITIDNTNNCYIVGASESVDFPTKNSYQTTLYGNNDVIVAGLNSSGLSLEFSTYLGGSAIERGFGIIIDKNGDIYITGDTFSRNFPTLNSFQGMNVNFIDGFVTKLKMDKSITIISNNNRLLLIIILLCIITFTCVKSKLF